MVLEEPGGMGGSLGPLGPPLQPFVEEEVRAVAVGRAGCVGWRVAEYKQLAP